ncbi:MAG: EAL domain-containing protein [Gammaproteobacteria bacterium]|nr:EAL domain-containing protein [Gammaproteobacteria bacterium]
MNPPLRLARAFHDDTLYVNADGGKRGVLQRMRLNVVVLSMVLLSLLSVSTWFVIQRGQQQLIEHQALEVAEIVAQLATSARSVYANQVVEKLRKEGTGSHEYSDTLPGYVPLPAQFLKLLGQQASRNQQGLYRYRPLSKWNLETTQGLNDDFEHWAWQQLESQDQRQPSRPITWHPVWRIEMVQGESTLRYLRADPASSQSCVDCHNNRERSPQIVARRVAQGQSGIKQWQAHQLLGAVEVFVPLGKIETLAKTERNLAFYTVLGVAIFGLLVMGFFIYIDTKRVRELARELTWHAQYDKLTGLLNRVSFDIRLKELHTHAKQWKEHHALLFLDLDQFKVINDTCGHMAGDSLLQELSPLLIQCIRDSDTLARLGGDEFGILLRNCTLEQAQQIAEKILGMIQHYAFDWHGKLFSVGVSIGVVAITPHSGDVASLMSAADMACYAAKDQGRNRVHILSEKEEDILQLREQMEWPSRIQTAINKNQLQLAMQSARAINPAPFKYYHEILLRLYDEQGNPIPTYTLIEAAERYNIMDRVDKWVINKTFSLISTGKIPHDADNIVAINLSGTTLNTNNFTDYISEIFAAFPEIPPSSICFEITETAAIYNLKKANTLIKDLKKFGCRFALDDFGSGLSSLTQLKNLSIDILKIDGAFIRDITNDHVDRAMVASVVAISRAMNLPTVGEWVENQSILDTITAMGITFAQGYHVHKPTLIVDDK